MNSKSRWMTSQEASTHFGLDLDQVEYWISSGELATRRISGVVTVLEAEVGSLVRRNSSSGSEDVDIRDWQLEAIQTHLQRANHLAQVGTMAMSIGHEINNPLTYVIGNNQYICSELLPELRKYAGQDERVLALLDEIRELADEVDEGASHIRRIVEEVRGLARQRSEESLVDVVSTIRTSVRMASPAWHGSVNLTSSLSPLRMLWVNEVHLSQVIINLVTNSVYAVQGISEPRIEISCFEESGRAYIEVSDNGSGISDQHLKRIFSPFFTTKPMAEGTGLGLSVCRGLVRGMGGDLAVESTLGVGTTMRVGIPFRGGVVEEESVPFIESPELDGLSILVIDDEPAVLRSIGRLLKNAGLQVQLQDEVSVACEWILEGSHDLILCDLMMPKMSGMALYRKVMELAPELCSRFVFMSGGPSTEEARAFSHAHASRLVNKPISLAVLQACLGRVIRSPLSQSEPCPNLSRCPMFPRFESEKMLSLYRLTYCEATDGAFHSCARYRSMGRGVRPKATLMPHGQELPPAQDS